VLSSFNEHSSIDRRINRDYPLLSIQSTSIPGIDSRWVVIRECLFEYATNNGE